MEKIIKELEAYMAIYNEIGQSYKEHKDVDILLDQLDELKNNSAKKIVEIAGESSDKYIRLAAEFDNYRKRVLKEKAELLKNASENIIKVILPVLDDLERGKNIDQITIPEIMADSGIRLIYFKLKEILTRQGLQKMDCLGKKFNPDLHDAITTIEYGSEKLSGTIDEVVENGYLLNDKVIKHARVIVYK